MLLCDPAELSAKVFGRDEDDELAAWAIEVVSARVVAYIGARIGRARVAETVPGGIERDDLATRHQRGHQIETACVVEPAVRSEHAPPARLAPHLCGEA